ncbi:FG-GAP-like repeat-containing protein [Streptomyces sp. NPDC054956]
MSGSALAAPPAQATDLLAGAGATPRTASAEDRAAANSTKSAAQSGHSVEVESARTEDSKTFANPDGTFTLDRYLRPVHVRQNGKFVPADDTLVAAKDGTIRPKAARADFAFSGGGDKAPLATVTKDGRQISLTWPGELPEPALDGDTATYTEVLPGVDLKVIAEPDSFSHVLVVKTPQAAKNPKLARLDFGLATKGLGIKADKDGNLSAVTPAGQTVFTAPKPAMWDSKGAKPAADKAAPRAQTAPEAAAPPGAEAAEGASPLRPSADPSEAAPESAKQAALGVELRGTALRLTPDQGLLTAADTTYPVVIDPTWQTDWKNLWAIAYKHNAFPNSANTAYINGGTLSKEARVGCAKDGNNGNQVVCAKTFFHVPMTQLHGKQILESTLRIKQTWAGSWSCQSGDVEVWDTNGITSATTWNNQPAWSSKIDATGVSFGGRSCPTAGGEDLVEFNVTKAAEAAAGNRWGYWAFGLKAKNDTVDVSWRKFDPETARISTNYNTPPATPSGQSTDPWVPCGGGSFGLVDNVTLRATLNDDEDNQVSAQFVIWKEGGGSLPDRWTSAVRGNVAAVTIPAGQLESNVTYRWDVRAWDGHAYSPWAGQCRFSMDKDRPGRPPTVTSSQFPDGSGGTWGRPARTDGTFTLGANGISDVVRYEWYTDFDTTLRKVDAADAGGSATVPFRPLSVGPQHMYVTSFDAAGNPSDVRSYLFYASRSATRDRYGDVNGDGTTDLWAVDKDGGQLKVHPGQGDGTFGLSRDADNSSFATVSVTHRGDWGQDGYEDLIVLKRGPDGAQTLYRRNNNGDGTLDARPTGEYRLDTLNPDNKRWSAGGQILSLGSVTDDTDDPDRAPDGVVDENDQPELLLLTGNQLWLYYPTRSDYLDESRDPVQIGDAVWAGKTVMTPGDTTGDGLPELWVRENDTGKVWEYRSRKDASGNFDPSAYADTANRTQIGTGFTAAAYPHLSTDGDIENQTAGTHYPDLWAIDPQGRVHEFPGKALSDGSAFGPARNLVTNSRTWNDCQTFDGPDTEPAELCGAVLSKYLALGGPTGKLRYPVTKSRPTPDGAGRYAHFQGQGTTGQNSNGSIYWSPNTGAWFVHGAIRTKWAALGWEQGFLGYPTGDEDRLTASSDAWISSFAGAPNASPGAITHYDPAGSHEMHGAIYAQYLQLGGPLAVGFPSTDESATPVKVGRYNHFRLMGAGGDTSSVYWSPSTGAHQVKGAIRDRWASMGWENSYLGFPTTDEHAVAAGARSKFENDAYIRWNSVTGITTDYAAGAETPMWRTNLTGDFDGDGRDELATMMDHRNCAAGLWTTSITNASISMPVERKSWPADWWCVRSAKYLSGDFNGDGRDDIAAMYGYPNGGVAFFTFTGRADGSFGDVKSREIPPGNWDWNAITLASGDYNGDGRDDIAMMYDFGGCDMGLFTLLGRPDAGFANETSSFRSGPGNWCAGSSTMMSGDHNGDGRDDLSFMYNYGNGRAALWTFLGTPGGGFANGTPSWTVPENYWFADKARYTTGDFNADGRTDIAAMYGYPDGRVRFFTFLAKADGGFNDNYVSYDIPPGNWEWNRVFLNSGNFNGDNRTDLMYMYDYGTTEYLMSVLPTQPNGTLGGSSPPSRRIERGTW